MIEIDDPYIREEVLKFLLFTKEQQMQEQEAEGPKKLIYSKFNLKNVVKNKICICSLLTHKLALSTRFFYEDQVELTKDEDVLALLKQILEYELSEDLKQISINSNEIAKIISAVRILESKVFKKNNNAQ